MECGPEFGGEKRVLIGDEVKHQSILAIPFIEEYHHNLGSSVHRVGGSYMNIGTEQVHHGQNGVFTMFLRKWSDEV